MNDITLGARFSFFTELKTTLLVSTPIVLTRLLNAIVGFAFMLMLASDGVIGLAAGSLIATLYMTSTLISWSFLFPMGALVAKLFGSEKYEDIGDVVRLSLLLVTLVSVPIAIFLWFLSDVLFFLKQPATLIQPVSQYFQIIVCGILPASWVATLNQFFNGIFRSYITTLSTLLNVVLTIALGYCLFYGRWGFPILGITGFAYAISIVYWINFLVLMFYIFFSSKFSYFKLFRFKKSSRDQYFKRLFTLGWPVSLQYGCELGAITTITMLIGLLGSNTLAAQQISLQYNMLAVMIPFALSQASAILIGHACGKQDYYAARMRGYMSILLGVFVSMFIGAIFILYPKLLISFYININDDNNIEVISIATIFLFISAITQVIDAIRNISIGALRGYQDTKTPMIVGLGSNWLIGLPVAYLLGFVFQMGAISLRIGFFLGILISAAILFFRFSKYSNKYIGSACELS